MSEPVRVAILGFSAFERTAMASYFNLESRRAPDYQYVLDVDNAHLIVADADQPSVVALLTTLARCRDAVFVGGHAPADAASWMMRPINPVHVMRELASLMAQRRPAAASHSAAAPAPAAPVLEARPAERVVERPDLAALARRSDDRVETEQARSQRRELADARRRRRAAALAPQVLRRALLVDDSEIALHFLRRQLEQYGLDCDFARHSDRALDLLSHHPYGLVFLDVDLGEDSKLDGLMLCQTLKQRLVLPGGRPPLVVMVSAYHAPVDQVRANLAGADAYLGKPLDFGALDRLLQAQGLSRLGQLPGAGPSSEPRPPRA